MTDFVQEGIMNYHSMDEIPYMMIHDELIFNRPKGDTMRQHHDFMQVMAEPSKLFEGFSAPIKAKIGERWGSMEDIQL